MGFWGMICRAAQLYWVSMIKLFHVFTLHIQEHRDSGGWIYCMRYWIQAGSVSKLNNLSHSAGASCSCCLGLWPVQSWSHNSTPCKRAQSYTNFLLVQTYLDMSWVPLVLLLASGSPTKSLELALQLKDTTVF